MLIQLKQNENHHVRTAWDHWAIGGCGWGGGVWMAKWQNGRMGDGERVGRGWGQKMNAKHSPSIEYSITGVSVTNATQKFCKL